MLQPPQQETEATAVGTPAQVAPPSPTLPDAKNVLPAQQQQQQQLAAHAPGLAGGSRPTPAPLYIPPRHRDPRPAPDAAAAAAAATRAAALAPAGNAGNWRQGKPIFDWISRKLGGNRRGSDAGTERVAVAEGLVVSEANGHKAYRSQRHRRTEMRAEMRAADLRTEVRSDMRTDPRTDIRSQLSPIDTHRNSIDSRHSLSARSHSISNTPSERRREANNPYPSLPIPLVRRSYPDSTIDSGSRPPSLSMFSRSRTPSIASLSSMAARRPRISIADDGSMTSGSFKLAGRVADEDASVRPIPPSPTNVSFVSPPPVADRRDTMSSSYGASYMSGASRQGSVASTKPTTVMSFDSSATPAHIAVAAPDPTPATPGITSSSSPTSATGAASSPVSASFPQSNTVPVHSRYHPRNNPNPSAAPRPDASIITLASSTFAAPSPVDRTSDRPWERIPHAGSLRIRDGASPSAYHPPASSPTVAFAEQQQRPGSLHDGLSTTMSLSVRTRDKYARADEDASVRALRRRGSWESGESRWSWRPAAVGEVFAMNRRSELFAEDAELRTSTYRQVLPYAAEEDNDSLHRPVSVSVSVV